MGIPSGPLQKNKKCHTRELTVFVMDTSIMAQNDILHFCEEDLRECTHIGASSLYGTHAMVRQSKL